MKNTKKYKRVLKDIGALKREVENAAKTKARTASSRSGAPIGVGRKAAPKKKNSSRSKISVDDLIAGTLKGVQKATGKNYAADILQHVTTPQECNQWMRTVKAMFTNADGKVDKKGYCNALNTVRDNILFTVSELKKAIDDAQRSRDNKAVPGYETMIEQHLTIAGMLEKEIKSNGGKVNK